MVVGADRTTLETLMMKAALSLRIFPLGSHDRTIIVRPD
tara:strand:+ start:357 stop:473 length:117 start_codon:yes stop_codon:yes gene_type:complete